MKNLSGLLAVLAVFAIIPFLEAQDNLLTPEDWTVGTGNVAGYTLYGDASENERIQDTGPFGNQEVLWVSDPNGGGSTDGGFYSPYANIDQTKTYRLVANI